MTRPRTTFGKRSREQQKREEARAKAERRTARRDVEPTEDDEVPAPVAGASEAELIEQLAALHRAFEAGDVGLEELETRQDEIRSALGRMQQ